MRISSNSAKSKQVDSLDFSIIRALQKDSRKPFTDIAKNLGVAESTIRNRVSRLLADETLQLGATFDFMKLGFNAPAFLSITVEPGMLDEVAENLMAVSEVSYLMAVTGDADLKTELTCRDHAHLMQTIKAIRKLNGIKHTSTEMILHVYKVLLPSLGTDENQP